MTAFTTRAVLAGPDEKTRTNPSQQVKTSRQATAASVQGSFGEQLVEGSFTNLAKVLKMGSHVNSVV